jgi:hypothetical protein
MCPKHLMDIPYLSMDVPDVSMYVLTFSKDVPMFLDFSMDIRPVAGAQFLFSGTFQLRQSISGYNVPLPVPVMSSDTGNQLAYQKAGVCVNGSRTKLHWLKLHRT